jgi:hypothetical protein
LIRYKFNEIASMNGHFDDIPFTKAGKYQWIISELADNYLEEADSKID